MSYLRLTDIYCTAIMKQRNLLLHHFIPIPPLYKGDTFFQFKKIPPLW